MTLSPALAEQAIRKLETEQADKRKADKIARLLHLIAQENARSTYPLGGAA